MAAASFAVSGSPSRSFSSVMCRVYAFVSFSRFCENCSDSMLASSVSFLSFSFPSSSSSAPLLTNPS